jgi:all-trans-8'-apo-beta-carotenal 15,15'-oxygenase
MSTPSIDGWSSDRTYRQALRSLRREHSFEPLRVVGTVPEELRGTLYRAGPGLFESFGRAYSHPFEADGAVTAVRFGAGRVEGGVQVVQSAGLRAEAARGKSLYGSPAPWWRRFVGGLRQDVKNTGNTAILPWQGRVFALMEAAKPTEIDPRTLATLGETTLDVVTGGFSAHPKRIPARETTYNFGMQYGPKPALSLYALPDRGPARRLTQVPLPHNAMVHDFACTETTALFLVAPVELVLWRAILQIGGFSDFFRWDSRLDTRLIAVPLDDPDRRSTVELDPLWVWHFGNAFDDAGRVVVDMSRYSDFTSLDAIAAEDDGQAETGKLVRAVVDLAAGSATFEQLDDAMAEFPVVHPEFRGRRHAATWTVHDRGLARFDHAAGTLDVHPVPAHCLATEPVFVPRRGGGETDGWILTLVLDAEADRSRLTVLDAAHMEREPVAEAWFDQPLPVTFHGAWMDDSVG